MECNYYTETDCCGLGCPKCMWCPHCLRCPKCLKCQNCPRCPKSTGSQPTAPQPTVSATYLILRPTAPPPTAPQPTAPLIIDLLSDSDSEVSNDNPSEGYNDIDIEVRNEGSCENLRKRVKNRETRDEGADFTANKPDGELGDRGSGEESDDGPRDMQDNGSEKEREGV